MLDYDRITTGIVIDSVAIIFYFVHYFDNRNGSKFIRMQINNI